MSAICRPAYSGSGSSTFNSETQLNLVTKTVVIILVAVTLLGAILYFTLSTILHERFAELERKEVSKSLDRLSNDLKNELAHLVTKTKDWAAWDDTYDFMKTSRKAYVTSNLTPESIIQLKIDAIIFFNVEGKLHYASAVDRIAEKAVPIWKNVADFFAGNKAIVTHDSIESTKSGLVRIGDKVALISSLPVITSEYTGPTMGSIVFLRFLNDDLTQEMASRTKLDLRLNPIEDRLLLSNGSIIKADSIFSRSDDIIVGTRMISDVFKRPLLSAEIELKRDVMKEGSAVIRTLLVMLAFSGVALSLVVVFLLQKTVLSRMLRLQSELSKIAKSADHEGRVTIQGTDELTKLADGINKTLVALQDAKRIAEDASRAKSDFVANMSHELRTPLNGVCAATELLSSSSLTEDQEKLVSIIDGSAKSLLVLISDVLDISKINAGKMSLSPIVFNLPEFIGRIVAAHELVADIRKIVIISNISQDLPKFVFTDQLRLGQVLNNLIGNSLKFTPEQGAIVFDVSVSNRDEDKVFLTFAVSDSGIGVSKEKEQAIFEAFSQADGSITRQYGGTGLGLAISNKLVEMLGGQLELRSIHNYGTRFFFTIPIQESKEETMKSHDIKDEVQYTKPLKCLLVEDNKTNQYLMARILGKYDFEVLIANDGLEALAISERQDFDVILMDCQMPNLDGYSATKRIREREEGTSKHVPIIALTACAMSEDRDKCLAAGMDDYVSKPIDQRKLFATIQHVVNRE